MEQLIPNCRLSTTYEEYMSRKGFASRLRSMMALIEKGSDPCGICVQRPDMIKDLKSCDLCLEIIKLKLPYYKRHSCPCLVLGSDRALECALEWLKIEEEKEKQINIYKKEFIDILKVLLTKNDKTIKMICPSSMSSEITEDKLRVFCMFCHEIITNCDPFFLPPAKKSCPCIFLGVTRAKNAANYWIKEQKVS